MNDNPMTLPYTLRSSDTTPPKRQTEGAAGYDLAVDEPVVIPIGATRLVTTGVSVAIPDGMVGKVHIRSSLGAKSGLVLANQVGIIDSDYRGEIKLALRNISNAPFQIGRRDRVAQLLIERVEYPELEQVDELPDTLRGVGGFGSTNADTNLITRVTQVLLNAAQQNKVFGWHVEHLEDEGLPMTFWVARELGCTYSRVPAWVADGKLTPYMLTKITVQALLQRGEEL